MTDADGAAVTLRQPLRWADTDALGHVWHGVHVALIEEVRTAWLDRALADGGGLWDHVVVRIELDFRGELRYADGEAVTRCRGEGCGRSSVRTAERIETPGGTLVAEARSVVVAWDAAARQARPLTAAERAAVAAATGATP